MKVHKQSLKHSSFSKNRAVEDMRYLQKKISGKSVYANINSAYRRFPKHKGRNYLAEFNALRGY